MRSRLFISSVKNQHGSVLIGPRQLQNLLLIATDNKKQILKLVRPNTTAWEMYTILASMLSANNLFDGDTLSQNNLKLNLNEDQFVVFQFLRLTILMSLNRLKQEAVSVVLSVCVGP